MKLPEAVTRIYDNLSQIAATTVITSNVDDWISRRFGTLCTCWNKEYHYTVSYPRQYALDHIPPIVPAAPYQAHCLLNQTLVKIDATGQTPLINITVEKTLHSDSIKAFNEHLTRLKKAGFCAVYRTDDPIKSATLVLTRKNQNGEASFSIQKYYVYSQYLYLITISEIDPKELGDAAALTGEIRQIVGSFNFIVSKELRKAPSVNPSSASGSTI